MNIFSSLNLLHYDAAFPLSFQREIVEQISKESRRSYSVICVNLEKVYRGQDGNADKIAVRGISISMSRGQCFGVLGPNGAGKTTLINMVSSNIDLDTIGCGM